LDEDPRDKGCTVDQRLRILHAICEPNAHGEMSSAQGIRASSQPVEEQVKPIAKRIRTLESTLIRPAAVDRWGKMAGVRDDLIRRAAPVCHAEVRTELEDLGPTGLWIEMARQFVADHGFIRAERESLAETTARALDIEIEELIVLISQGRIARAFLARFP
jgi:hypothetical protein